MFVKFIASLGQKFNFSVRPHDPIPIRSFNVAFDKLLDKTNQYGQKLLLEKDLNEIHDELVDNSKNLGSANVSPAQHFIRQLSEKTELFLQSNSDIIIAPADKGGKVVIMDKSIYKQKVMEHLKTNIANHTYFHWKGASVDDCRKILEPSYDKIRMKLNECFAVDEKNFFKNLCMPLEQEPYMIARLLMLVKIHKEGFPVRPIIAAPDCWAKKLSKWILGKLKLISILFDDFKVKNSEEFVNKYSGIRLRGQDHRLSSWDYDSMFTNIPFPFVKRIISENYEVVSKETSVPVDLFIESISFLIEHSCYFLFDGEVYRQAKGLTMGNMLSQMLAEIATNYATKRAIQKIDTQDISFLGKYVDDFGGAMKQSVITTFEEELTSVMKGLKIKRTDESSTGSITFLDTLILRNEDQVVTTRWWFKECSAMQILNYHSFHPMQMKWNVVNEYVRHAIRITSPELMHTTVKNLRLFLKRSSYPKKFTEPIIKNMLSSLGGIHVTSSCGYTDACFSFEREVQLDGQTKTKSKGRYNNQSYVPIPLHNMETVDKIKDIVKHHLPGCYVAPSTTRTNRQRIFSKLKDKASSSGIKFAIFKLKCANCLFMKKFRTNNLDVWRSAKHYLNQKDSLLMDHISENPGHAFLKTPFILERFKSSFDLRLAFSRF